MTRGIKRDNTLRSKVSVLLAIQGIRLSEGEENSLLAVITYSDGAALHISAHTGGAMKKEFNLNDSSFSVGLHRLEKKKLIARSGKTISLNPMFNNIGDLEKLVISFV
jgi:hypothetical protein